MRKASPQSLVGKRLCVWGTAAAATAEEGRVGLVVDVRTARGAKTKHLVRFDDAAAAHGGDAPTEEVLLQKKAGGTGCRFVLLDAAPSAE